jgi:2'-5' RNA ligase
MKALIKEEKVSLPKGCLMVLFDLPKWPEFVSKFIDSEDFEPQKWMEDKATYEQPHVTILYGFDPEVTLDEVKALLMPLEEINVEFKSIGHFGNENFDVVNFVCESEQLRQMRTVVETLPNEQTYPDYNIHATIAYVKPGEGAKHEGAKFTPFTLKPSKYLFSAPDGTNEEFTL